MGKVRFTQGTSATPDATSGPRLKLFVAELLKNLREGYLVSRICPFLVYQAKFQ